MDRTCAASLKPRAEGGHSPWVCSLVGFPHTHVEGTSRNVATIEPDIDGVDAILTWNEADLILVCKEEIPVSEA